MGALIRHYLRLSLSLPRVYTWRKLMRDLE